MKKNNSYLADNEINLIVLIEELWKEKILILFISIICVLLGYGSQYFKTKEFKAQVKINVFNEHLIDNFSLENFFFSKNLEKFNRDKNLVKSNINFEFNSQFHLNFLSLDNLETFLEQSREHDNFKAFLKSKNSTVKKYFFGEKLGAVKAKNDYTADIYFLIFTEVLDGATFINEYAKFIYKITIIQYQNYLKNNIDIYEAVAQKVELKKNKDSFDNEKLDFLFFQINYLKKKIKKLENEQTNYNFILEKAINVPFKNQFEILLLLISLLFGIFFSFIIILFKLGKKNKI